MSNDVLVLNIALAIILGMVTERRLETAGKLARRLVQTVQGRDDKALQRGVAVETEEKKTQTYGAINDS